VGRIQVEGHIVMTDLGTPLSNTTFLGAAKGEVYGMAHTPTRFQLPWLRPTSPIQGLYLSGQDIVTDGVLGAAIGGVLCAIGVGIRSLFTGGWRAIVKAIKLLL
jgi:all-trans-retinol 13,14-reductase